ncbi:MAG: Lrp/AsnC ligand binding domain-containing protein [Acidimicrobiales bacterium]
MIDLGHLTGKVDYRLRVVVASPADLDDLLMSMKQVGGIAETDTRLILRRYPTGGGGPD